MRIVGAEWTPEVNVLTIECLCGTRFTHRTDRWKAHCPGCNDTESLQVIRARRPNFR